MMLYFVCACRILLMMQKVASHKAENRMSTSAVAACMAPLLLRPLLAGECEIENDFDVGGDGSMQLLQAAAAANHAQAIVITLMEEYDKIFSVSCKSLFLFRIVEIERIVEFWRRKFLLIPSSNGVYT